MLYLSGGLQPAFEDIPGLGFILTPNQHNHVPANAVWAADNGCYTTRVEFDLDRYLRWLWERRWAVDRCLFATAPDVVGDAAATWQRGAHILPCIRGLGFKAAYCVQNGIVPEAIEWDSLDAIFVGGDTEFKLAESTYALVAEARRRGKWTHMGRVNSRIRFRAAAMAGYDSVDGTHLTFRPRKYLKQVQGWIAHLEQQPALFGEWR